nr:hypothetical protein [Thiocapsa sp. KS1]
MEHIKRSASFRQCDWQPRCRSTTGDVLHDFYIPALCASVRYDRVAGYFRSTSLAAASQGFSALVENNGHVRLVAGPIWIPRMPGSSSITGTTGVSPRPCWRTWPTGKAGPSPSRTHSCCWGRASSHVTGRRLHRRAPYAQPPLQLRCSAVG